MATQNGYKRKCEATNNRGEPCKSPPLKGQAYCLSHSGNAGEKVGFVARNGKQGRKRKPTSAELYEKWWRENETDVLRALVAALHSERAVVVGTGPKARLELVPDYELRLKAARELMDRHHGKARQTHDITHHTESEVDVEIQRLLAEMDDREHAPR